MIEGSIQWEDITTINIYAPNTGAPKYIKKILPRKKIETDSTTVIMGDSNTSLTSMDRWSRENQWGETGLGCHIRSDGHNKYIEGIPAKKQQNTYSFQVHKKHSPG